MTIDDVVEDAAPAGEPEDGDNKGKDLGQFIHEQRQLARLSVRKLSELAGVSNPYLSQIERGLRKPSAEILNQIANALRISSETLYVRAGLLAPDKSHPHTDVTTSIAEDTSLTDDQKATLIAVYRNFVVSNGARKNSTDLDQPADE